MGSGEVIDRMDLLQATYVGLGTHGVRQQEEYVLLGPSDDGEDDPLDDFGDIANVSAAMELDSDDDYDSGPAYLTIGARPSRPATLRRKASNYEAMCLGAGS